MTIERPVHDNIWSPHPENRQPVDFWRLTVAVVCALTLVRIVALFLSRLELYPDEAQYWLWSRRLAFGYFSKPPVVAWLIRATTALGGDSEAWVRMSAPVLHGAAAMVLARAASVLVSARVGLLTALLYLLAPGILLSSALIATDAPLLLFIALAIWSYSAIMAGPNCAPGWRGLGPYAGMGLSIGVAFLTKYAALYLIGGLALHAMVSREARRRWSRPGLAMAIAVALAVAAPNLIWNAQHHFQTVAHTADNADIGGKDAGRWAALVGPRGPLGFVLGQFGVFGPAPFAAALWASVAAIRRGNDRIATLLFCLAAPAFAVVLGEAVVARANANWAAAGYPPAFILAAIALDRVRLWRTIAVATQGIVALAFIVATASPRLIDAAGAASAVKRARGWSASAAAVETVAREQAATGPLSSVVVDDRFLFNALSYYGRGPDGTPAGALPAPLRMWVHLGRPMSQAEAEAPMDAAYGARSLAVSTAYLDAFRADFAATEPLGHIRVPLGDHYARRLNLFLGERFQPQPRDPVTGRPKAP